MQTSSPHWTRPLLIVAGSYEQARAYADRAGLRRGQYISVGDWTHTRGRNHPDIMLVGTYRERTDFEQIVWALLPTRPRCRDERGRWASLRR